MLEHLAGDVKAQVLGIHQPLYKAEAVGKEIGALFHNEDAAGVELEALFIIPAVVVVGGAGGDEEQGVVGGGPFGAAADHPQGGGEIPEFILVELVHLLIGNLALRLLPDGDHGIEGLNLLVVLVLVLGALLLAGAGHLHADGVADVIGVPLHQPLEAVALQKLVVALLLGVVLDGEDDGGAGLLLLAGGDGVAVAAVGFPAEGLLAAGGAGDDLHLLRYHKGGVEAHPELADNIHVVTLAVLLLEGQ